LLNMPQQVYEILPIGVLIGALLGWARWRAAASSRSCAPRAFRCGASPVGAMAGCC
jgi:hypothetical protein